MKFNHLFLLPIYLLLPISLFAPTCYGADRYVSNQDGCDNSGNGTEAVPWCSIQKAAESARAGDTVHIMAGNYRENIRFLQSGSTEDGHIIFNNYKRDVVNLDPGSLEMEDKSYLMTMGLHIKNSPKERPGIDIGGDGSHVQILRVRAKINSYF